jgi:hypothetical protein
MQYVWGSSAHDVWATGHSDAITGDFWHYDGKVWHPVHGWPTNGTDNGGSFDNDLSTVLGFDSTNVFVFGDHGYDTTGTDLVLKWNGSAWSYVPWQIGNAPIGGIGWAVRQNDDKLWAVSTTGDVIKYEAGVLTVDSEFTGYRLDFLSLAALDNGEVYVVASKDSGAITPINLYERNSSGAWSVVDRTLVNGGGSGNGLGPAILAVGDHIYSTSSGLWEWVQSTWIERRPLTTYSGIGGACFTSENDMWLYFEQMLWHYDGNAWSTINVPALSKFPGYWLYGIGWSDGKEVFIPLLNGSATYMLHGKLKS